MAAKLDVTNGKNKGPLLLKKRLVQVMVNDPEALLYHGEVLLRDGVMVGDIRAASYGHTLGGAVGLGHIAPREGPDGTSEPVTAKYLKTGKWEVDIAGKLYPITVSLKPLYDPTNERIKA